jgi:hypothetical protein
LSPEEQLQTGVMRISDCRSASVPGRHHCRYRSSARRCVDRCAVRTAVTLAGDTNAEQAFSLRIHPAVRSGHDQPHRKENSRGLPSAAR